jgi:hypothetical protein
MADFYLGDYGMTLTLNLTENGVAANLSGANSASIKFEDPDGTQTTAVGTIATSAVTYTIPATLFPTTKNAGWWKGMVAVTWTATKVIQGEFRFEVANAL